MKYVDYYQVLDVPRTATQDEIAKAYKKLARLYHPDLNKGHDAEDQFKQVNEAYEVLKDPEKRRRFDTLGANWKHGAPFTPPSGFGGPGSGGVHVDFGTGGAGFSSFFDQVFGGGGGAGGGVPFDLEELLKGQASGGRASGGRRGKRPSRGRTIESTLEVGLEDIYHGKKLSVTLSGEAGNRRLDVTLPRGLRDGETIRLTGQGQPGSGGKPGDLLLTITVRPHPRFRVEGDDLVTVVDVLVWDAALGGKLPVPTLDGEVQMTIPAGLSSGQRLRLKGKGLPVRSGGQGDLFAELRLVLPRVLTDEQRQLFARLKELAV